MAVSRPLLIALAGALLLCGAFFASRALSSGQETSSPADATPAPPAEAAATPGGGASPARPARDPREELPDRVLGALTEGKVIVFLFTQTGAADDTETRRALRAIDRAGGDVEVLHDSIREIGRYKRVVSGVGVSQAPALVIVGRDRKARVLEGYIDPGTMRQVVRDAGREVRGAPGSPEASGPSEAP